MKLPTADRIALLGVAAATLLGLSLTVFGAYAGVVEEPEPQFEDADQAALHEAMRKEFGGYLTPLLDEDWGLDRLADGMAVYEVQCIHCHGVDGRADTYTARLLTPPPRDFSQGVVKFTSTPVGLPATRDDLLRVVRDGVATTSMSAFHGLPEEEIDAVVDYAMYLLIRGAVWQEALRHLDALGPDLALELALENEKQRFALAEASSNRPPLPPIADSKRGEELYFTEDLGCVTCHRTDGSGGPVESLDIWGHPMVARDLRVGELRGGGNPSDIYLRIRNGVKGTPMPAMADQLEPQAIWDLVAYVHSVQEAN